MCIDKVDKLFIIGCDPRREATILNARIRQRWLTGNLEIFSLCTPEDLTYDLRSFGNNLSLLNDKSFINEIKNFFKDAKFPMFIIGDNLFINKDGNETHSFLKSLAQECKIINENWNGFCILSSYASRAGGLEIGFIPSKKGLNTNQIKDKISLKAIKLLFLIEADDFNLPNYDPKYTKIVYLGHHGDKLASKADIILPITAFTEKKALYVNIEGRPQFTKKIIEKKGVAVDGWKVFRALGDLLNIKLCYNSHSQLIEYIFKKHPEISRINFISNASWIDASKDVFKFKPILKDFSVSNYYQTCPITRASNNMANCAKAFLDSKNK